MPAFASTALATAVVVSALGAVVLCCLVVLYGFTPSDEDTPEEATRRLVLTRLGHAVAAGCFTATAILIATVLVQRPATPAPVAAAITDRQAPALGEQIAGQESRLARTEARIRELEEALRRHNAERSAPAVERPAPSVERPAPAPSRQLPAAPAPNVSTQPRSAAPPSAVRASEGSASRESSPPAASPAPARVGEPPAGPPTSSLPSSPAVTAPAPTAPPLAAAPTRSAPSDAASSAEPPPTPRRGFALPDKLRDDWREIQRGVDSAGDDFRGAVDNLKRRLLGE